MVAPTFLTLIQTSIGMTLVSAGVDAQRWTVLAATVGPFVFYRKIGIFNTLATPLGILGIIEVHITSYLSPLLCLDSQ